MQLKTNTGLSEYRTMQRVFLSAGSNVKRTWGHPSEALSRALKELSAHQAIEVVRVSRLFKTKPVGQVSQPAFLNLTIELNTGLSPFRLLAVLKRLERRAGRRLGTRWGPRPLDIDIIDHGGRKLGWPPIRKAIFGRLILPHAELHRRAFVLVPLAEMAPQWRHPVLGLTARQLLRRLRPAEIATVVPCGELDS